MFNFFHKQYPKNETALVFSVESGEVVSALVHFEGTEKPLILYTKRESINIDTHGNPEHLTPLMLFALKKSTEDMVINGFIGFASNSKKIPIERIYVFLGSPWYKSGTIQKTIQKEKPFIITSEFLDLEAEKFFDSLPTKGVHLEKKIISIKANGYNMEHPLGRKAASVDLGAYVSIADVSLVEEIKSILLMSFPNFEIRFHTISIAVQSVMSSLQSTKDYLLLIPEQDVCEFILVSKGIFEAVVSAPFGKHKIIEYIAKEHGSTKEEAISLLRLWKEGVLEPAKAAAIETIIDNAQKEWSTYVRGAMSALGKFVLLPSQVFVAGKSIESALLAQWLEKEEYTNQTFSIEKFSVTFFSQKDIHPFIESKVPKEFVGTVIGSCVLFLRFL